MLLKKGQIKCIKCEQPRSADQFIATKNLLAFPSGKVNFCKDCRDEYIDIGNMETVYDVLMMLDKPFMRDVWETAKRETTDPKGVFGKYVKSLNGKQFKDKVFRESVFEHVKPVSVSGSIVIEEVTPEIRDRWKHVKNTEDMIPLEEIYQKLLTTCNYEDLFTQEINFKNMAKIQLSIERSNGDVSKEIKSLRELMSESGISPKDKNAQFGSFSLGERIKKYEETKPIPEVLPALKDVDKIEYLAKFFIKQMKKVFGFDEEKSSTEVGEDVQEEE